MPDMDISSDQQAYLDDLRSALAERHVGDYGTVRPRDALQFLIDHYEGDVDGIDAATDSGVDTTAGADSDGSGGTDGSADSETANGPGRLQAMMALLDDHGDKWEETDGEGGKYAVTLPDGETEQVRTKDDVRALLFKHYT